MNYLYILGWIAWYGIGITAFAVAIWFMVYFARIMDITKRQVITPFIVGCLLSPLSVYSMYLSQIHSSNTFIDNIYIYGLAALAPSIVVCIIYFLFAGAHNIQNKYHFDIRYKKLREIKRLKEIIGEREGL